MDDHSRRFPYTREPINYEEKLIGWALEYNAYNRLAGTGSFPAALREVLLPLIESYKESGVIPQWAGVDLLRAWAFYLVRINRHEDGYLLQEHPEMHAIVAAVTKHPAARESDMPPLPEEDDYDVFGTVHARLARLKNDARDGRNDGQH